MATATPRHGLPNIAVAQAQKEVTHNEALLRIDALLHCCVEASLSAPPAIAAPDAGKCWRIVATASGAWLGKEGQLACWTGEAWRYLAPSEGMQIWQASDGKTLQFRSGQWRIPASISEPVGGAVIDSEARVVVAALLVELRAAGLLAT